MFSSQKAKHTAMPRRSIVSPLTALTLWIIELESLLESIWK